MLIVQVSKKFRNFVAMGILNFESKIGREVSKYIIGTLFFFFDLVDPFPTYGRSSNFRHWIGGR